MRLSSVLPQCKDVQLSESGAKMSGFQNRKGQDLQKPIPGCMGRMINIFDLSSGMPRTKLLTDKPHQDASPIHTNRPDVVKKQAMDNFGVPEEKTIMGRKYSSKKSTGTPIKTLIAQEMSREPQSMQKPSNVVAKLMGLDMLPAQQSTPTARSSQEGYLYKCPSGEFEGCRQQEDSFCHNKFQFDTKSCVHEKKCKDVYEVWQQPPRPACFKDKPQHTRRYDDSHIEKRMALVHQKFTEAKRLATDEKLLQSKEFQEALEVLSSNRDLFLKFLEGPNTLFSKHHPESQTISPGSQARRITVLKPSRIIEPKIEAQERKSLHPSVKDIDPDIHMKQKSSRSSNFVRHKAENISEPTRIVVLKPNPGMSHETRAEVASLVPSSKRQEGRECYGSLGPNDETESREIAKEITRQMQEHMSSDRKDEILVSSALSTGYVGDESSFNRSDDDCIKEEFNASDSESISPTSRHSWDYSCRLGSPFSVSSFSRTSYSPEPSVVKEAKKRLSQRLAMVSSNGTGQSQLRRSSSTLGEMLSIAEVKKEGADNLTISSRRSCGEEQDRGAFTSCLSIGGIKGRISEDPFSSFARSKSVPVSSSVYENIRFREEVPGSMISKSTMPNDVVAKPKSGMSSLKGKVSSLLLSRIKKAGRDKPIPSCFLGPGKRHDTSLEYPYHSEESIAANLEGEHGKCHSTSLNGSKQAASILKGSHPSEKSTASENPRENQDQPSPISILEAPFEDDASSAVCQPSASILSGHPQALSRSPPIGSISRTLTWENPRETQLGNPSKLSRVLSRECEEQERCLLVQKLLSCANLLDIVDRGNVLAGWHSLESPLDPLLLDDFLDRKEEEAKCRERRSNQRLLFDCVNAALLSIGQTTLTGTYRWATAYGWASKDRLTRVSVADEVLRLVKDWFSCDERQVSGEPDNRNMLVDRLVKSEIAGRGWADSMCLEVDEFSREIGAKLLEELVDEALADLIDGCL